MNKCKLAITFGGCSEEHLVSVQSAQQVAKNINTDKYEIFYVGITKDGVWKLCDSPDQGWENSSRSAILSPDRGVHGLLVAEEGQYKTVRLDAVFSVLQGKLGEDGAMQGLLEISGIPYVGCGIQSSVLCQDKSITYALVKEMGIATPKFWVVTGDEDIDPDELPYPVFVKPAHSGSSFGVRKVSQKEELPEALRIARQYDSKVLIEEMIDSSDVGCAILGNDDDLFLGELSQLNRPHSIYKVDRKDGPKTDAEKTKVAIPADIPESTKLLVKKTAKAIYRMLGCKGLSRVDLFLKEDGTLVFNEVNSIPAMTTSSLYPMLMAAAGLPFPEVIDRLVALAMSGENDT